MKNVLYLFALLIVVISCKNETTEAAENDDVVVGQLQTLKGVWELVSFYNYTDNEVSDTVPANESNRQVKIYTNTKVMWSRVVPRDSTEYFAYGSYIITDSTLTETLEYGSTAMLNVIDTSRVFSFELQKTPTTYSQIIVGPEGDRVFSENYELIEDY